ncbi:hypothetical protein PGTUg99_004596 [Puccinia graminis f. sp. tritici]|uniref:Uncharacterized protein n=1 Tax=Puccinia graminis f. sp. tritici TaxID=56615 RepID=A0A5B0QYW2_PUCGR|nr:hypothetical protein PGTUg99_004596 [Puccinia graminis f. sp. tritici]
MVVKKVKKQFKSPEEVPSEWDESNTSSKSEKPNSIGTRIVKTKRISSSNNRPAAIEKTQAESDPVKNKSDGSLKPVKLLDPLPKADPFKSKEKPSKLIDKDSISHLTFKKVDQASLAVDKAASTKISDRATDQEPRKGKAAVRVDPLSEAAKTLLNGPRTFKEPINQSTQKSLDNYFVPQGRTVRSISSRSSDHPGSSATSSSSVVHSDGSDLNIITGATAQLWSKPKTLPVPLEEDILLRYPPAHHPLLQAVKLNREYCRKAEKMKDESMKVVALRAAAGLQKDLLVSINLEEFQGLFQWNPMDEFDEYLNTQKGRRFLKERGTEVTPTPPPEVLMQPPEAERSHTQPQNQPEEYQSQAQMFYHPNGYYYPYQPMNQPAQNQCWPQQGYNQEYSTYQQGYYPPQQWVNNQTAQAETPIPPQQTGKKESDQASKSNHSRPNNRKAKGPNWIPPPTLKRAPRDSWEANARERRRRSHQEMIRLNRTTQAQFQALEAMRNQNAGGKNRRQPREGVQTPKN